jgi:hypothetical protein
MKNNEKLIGHCSCCQDGVKTATFKENDGTIRMVSEGAYGGIEAMCVIGRNVEGNNSDCEFELLIKGGQVENGHIKMSGPWERSWFIPFLEEMLLELKNIDTVTPFGEIPKVIHHTEPRD